MIRMRSFRLKLIIFISSSVVLALVLNFIPTMVHGVKSSPFDSLSDEDKILAIQQSLGLERCLKKVNNFLPDKVMSNVNYMSDVNDSLPNIAKFSDRIDFGGNIVTDDGEAECMKLIKGHPNVKGIDRIFKLNERLNTKEKLWVDFLGYRKVKDDNNENYTYELSAKIDYGGEYLDVKNTVVIDKTGEIVNTNEDNFANAWLKYGPLASDNSLLRKLWSEDPAEVADGEKALKTEYIYYFTRHPHKLPDASDCKQWNNLYGGNACSAFAYERENGDNCECGLVADIETNAITMKKTSISDTFLYKKGEFYPGADFYANKYLLENFFGNNFYLRDLSQNSAERVLAYKFWYNYLFTKADSTSQTSCSAEKILKTDADNSNKTKFGEQNPYKHQLKLVDGDGKLKDYWAIWGNYNSPDYIPKTKFNKRVGYYKDLTEYSEADCKRIAEFLAHISGKLTKDDIKKIQNDSKYTGVDPVDGPADAPPAENTSSASSAPEKTCYTNAGRSLGWILCPLLDFFKDTAQNIYQHIANNYLEISPQMFTGGGQALFAAWQIFQGIANIGFVIFLLVIIFSQLTGKGIDNYGVKRALPRLIIAAILINLSYFLCQIAVDLSNIVGKGVYDLFTSFEFNATKGVNSLATDLGTTLQSIQTGQTATGLTMFGILAGLLAGGIAVVSVGPLAALVALLISLFTAVVAILIVFVLLGLRQALAIILVATSPVAFVCYIFPGTQKLFTKWTKILSGILLTFPICGIMMGGGEFASKLLLSTGQTGFFFGLVAMLAAIAPLFFVPVVLRNSLAAVGNIGAKVSTFASGLGKKAQSGIRNNENYKNWRTRQAAGLKYDKDGKLVESRSGKFRNRIAGSSFGRAFGVQRNMSRGRAGALKELSDRTTAESLMSSDRLEAANAAQIEKATQATMDDKMALINAQTNNGAIIVGDSNAFNEYEAAKASGDTSGMRTALSKLGTENSVFGQYKRAQAKGDRDGMRSALEVAGQSKTTAKEFKRALAMDMATNADSYTAADYSAIAKQMVNGKGSQNWKMSGAEAFEWATQVNSGRINPADNSSEQLSNWATSGNNLKNVVENQIASSEQIAGLSSSNLEEINRNINAAAGAGDVKALEAQSMLKANATQTLSDYTSGTRDIGVDKLDNIAKAAGYSDFADYENQQAKATLYLQQEEDFKRAIGSLDPTKLRARHSRETDANKRKIISDMYKNKTGKPI